MAPKNNANGNKKNKAARAIQALVRGNQARKRNGAVRPNATSAIPSFGDVSAISTAPVAIGNSMRGFKSRTSSVPGGVRIIGRDYGFTPAATGTVTGWACTGGMPLTPACMPTTILRNFVQMYSKFKINQITYHYITSSSTATTGDVVFYNQKEAKSSMINWTSSTFLPFVLSEPENVIGPQWTNHSVTIRPKAGFKMCDPFINSNQNDDSYGDMFLHSKTSSTESPGYVILDYDITFVELEYNPRAAYLPKGSAQWNPFALVWSEARTQGDNGQNTTSTTSGMGGTTITKFVTPAVGDIYKMFVDVTNSTFTTGTAANLWEQVIEGNSVTALTMSDGFTVFAVKYSGDVWKFHINLESALTGTQPLLAGATLTYAVTLRGFAKYIATADLASLQYTV